MSSESLNTNPVGSIDQDIWDRFLAGDLPINGLAERTRRKMPDS